jgi:hypothetical protein
VGFRRVNPIFGIEGTAPGACLAHRHGRSVRGDGVSARRCNTKSLPAESAFPTYTRNQGGLALAIRGDFVPVYPLALCLNYVSVQVLLSEQLQNPSFDFVAGLPY